MNSVVYHGCFALVVQMQLLGNDLLFLGVYFWRLGKVYLWASTFCLFLEHCVAELQPGRVIPVRFFNFERDLSTFTPRNVFFSL